MRVARKVFLLSVLKSSYVFIYFYFFHQLAIQIFPPKYLIEFIRSRNDHEAVSCRALLSIVCPLFDYLAPFLVWLFIYFIFLAP